MAIRMALRLITIFIAVLATVNSQPSPVYASGGEKPEHSNLHSISDDNTAFAARAAFGNCGGLGQGFEELRDSRGKEFSKIPVLHLENPRYVEERLFLPLGGLRSKKSQKAILLDVGDYVIKGNGSPMEETGARSTGGNMGGILRSSG